MLVSDSTQGVPDGDVHQWFTRSRALVDSGDANAALLLIDRVLAEDPQSTAALEIKARALFDSKQFHEAAEVFTILTERSPDDDYARYGLGVSLWRLQQFVAALEQLSMAAVMSPDQRSYSTALQQVRATINARVEAGLALTGPIDTPRREHN